MCINTHYTRSTLQWILHGDFICEGPVKRLSSHACRRHVTLNSSGTWLFVWFPFIRDSIRGYMSRQCCWQVHVDYTCILYNMYRCTMWVNIYIVNSQELLLLLLIKDWTLELVFHCTSCILLQYNDAPHMTCTQCNNNCLHKQNNWILSCVQQWMIAWLRWHGYQLYIVYCILASLR